MVNTCDDCKEHPVMVEKMKHVEKRIEDYETTLYHEEIGIVYMIRDCLTKKSLYVFLGSILFILVLAFITVNTMWADTRDYPETKKKVELVSQDVISLKERVKAIEEWKKEDQDLKKEIIQVLREVKKEKEEKTK